jgi:lipopolysaccharide/colanic/teichoic acid biosynthesis glycosyltransferase
MSERSIGAMGATAGIPQGAADRARPAVSAFCDLLLAVACLIVLGPVMALAAAAVLLESGRPIFFTQIRVGQNGKPFRLHKFRKFRKHAKGGGGALTLKNDPRLTKVGRLLERTKLDELPQLWNVLRRDMSVVGPRPESLHFADCFAEYSQLLDYKPGIFGPAQAIFRNEGELHATSVDPETLYRKVLFPAKARIDLAYYPERTVIRDIGWMVLGLLAVLGLARVPQMGRNTVQEMEDWVGDHRALRWADLRVHDLAAGE